MEVLAAIAYPCIRTEPDYIGRKTAAKAKPGALERYAQACWTLPCLEQGAGLPFRR
jgi:hypothetical protein